MSELEVSTPSLFLPKVSYKMLYNIISLNLFILLIVNDLSSFSVIILHICFPLLVNIINWFPLSSLVVLNNP